MNYLLNYDLKNEFANDSYRMIENPIEKFLIYKSIKTCISNTDKYNNAKVKREEDKQLYVAIEDPDWKSNNEGILKYVYSLSGMRNEYNPLSDAMTSILIPIESVYELFLESDLKDNNKYRNMRTSIYKLLEMRASKDYDIINKLAKIEGLLNFAQLGFTIGNYIPVSPGFNCERSNGGKNDSWDLTLMKIHEWFKKEDNDVIFVDLLHNKCRKKENVLKWLKSYGVKENGWENFIIKNYLEDFVDKNFNPIEFCDNHNWEHIIINDPVQYMCTCSKRIFKRGERIIAEIKQHIVDDEMKYFQTLIGNLNVKL